jgi:hypothetical protein
VLREAQPVVPGGERAACRWAVIGDAEPRTRVERPDVWSSGSRWAGGAFSLSSTLVSLQGNAFGVVAMLLLVVGYVVSTRRFRREMDVITFMANPAAAL